MRIIFRHIPLEGNIAEDTIDCPSGTAFEALKFAKDNTRLLVIEFGRIYVDGVQVTPRQSRDYPVKDGTIITMVEDVITVGELIVI